MKQKSEAFQVFKDFAAAVLTQYEVRIKRIQSDRGGEFMSQQFQEWMKRNGICQQTSAPSSPAQNGISERRGGVLQTMFRCLLEDAGMDFSYWGEALRYANYIVNRIWSSAIQETPYYLLHAKKPDVQNIHIFGCYATVNIPLDQRRKGGPVSERMRFIGMDHSSKYFKFADTHHRAYVSNSAKFEEDTNWSSIHSNDTSVYFPKDVTDGMADPDSQAAVPDDPDVQDDEQSSTVAEEVSDDELEDGDDDEQWTKVPRRSKRTTKGNPPKRFAQQVSQSPFPYTCNNLTLPPEHFHQIKLLPESEQQKWYEAMERELDCLKKLKVFQQVEPPTDKKIIGTRWVYRVKQKPNEGKLYKARLVAQGFSQIYPDDYTDTFSPTVRNESVKIALITAIALNLEVFQFDVETAYLNADLNEEIYVKSAPGFQDREGDVWYLHKSLYGLKQSVLMWYLCLIQKLNLMGFIKSVSDECVFTKGQGKTYEIVLVYVDDIVYIGPNERMSETFAKGLEKHFTLKSLGHINDYLGVQIEKTEKGFSLSQESKVNQLLQNCKMSEANVCRSPMQTDFYRLAQEEHPKFENQTLYRSVIGSLLYISSWTRPDISLSVNLLSRYVGKATTFHWSCIKRLLRYMKLTQEMKLFLEPEHDKYPEVICYADADWAGDVETRKSTSGYILFLNGCPIFWKVRKQKFISCSSTEAEYACVSDCCNVLTCVSALIDSIWECPKKPIIIMEDNVSVTYIAEAECVGARSRHIDIRYKNARECVKEGFVKIQYVPTTDQIADLLNKPLPADQHEYLTNKMCLK